LALLDLSTKEVVLKTSRSINGMLILALAVFALAIVPAGFAGEGNGPGPTQAGEIVGPQGPPGPAGPAGPAGTQGANGANGAAGETGEQGSQGPAGETGATGPKGETGAAGVAGASHTISKKSSGGVLGTSIALRTTTTKGTTGIQAGAGGMASAPAFSLLLVLVLAGGGLLSLGAAARLAPHRRSEL
jgi:hypothetical protein